MKSLCNNLKNLKTNTQKMEKCSTCMTITVWLVKRKIILNEQKKNLTYAFAHIINLFSYLLSDFQSLYMKTNAL